METPLEKQDKLAAALGMTNALYFKREDLGAFGSHKGRSIPYMIEHHRKAGIRHFALSSSGNAARAAAGYIRQIHEGSHEPLSLHIFVGPHITPEKKASLIALADEHISIEEMERPLQALTAYVKEHPETVSLRQSKDDHALVGYGTLAAELTDIPDLAAIFIPTSSGTTAEALAQYLKRVQIHLAQTTAVHPIASCFDTEFQKEGSSLARAIVDRVAHRKQVVEEAVRASSGWGWVISNREIDEAQHIVKGATDLDLSATSALGVAGLRKAIARGWKWSGSVVCLITGA